MIQADQPTCFGGKVIAAVSSSQDGQMQHGWQEPDQVVTSNRATFLKNCAIAFDTSVLVRVQYREGATYDVIRSVGAEDAGVGMRERAGIPADCLVTSEPGVGLFLPIADCIGTVVYDPQNSVLALVHLGRHSTIAGLARKIVAYLSAHYQSDPAQLIIWMAPSIKAPHYVLKTADFVHSDPSWNAFCTKVAAGYSLDLHGYNQSQFISAGVLAKNIHISPIDTTNSANYWSHYTQTSVHDNQAPPRFAVVCALK